jgi:threonine/homoserine/homoserine lactone efflux protein
MLLASGVNHGWRASVPHQLGIILGLCSLLAAVGAGLGALLAASPTAMVLLKAASAAYLLWLAWKIGNSGSPSAASAAEVRPLSAVEAATFQWINPKAWAMALTGVAAYTRPDAYGLTLGVLIAIMLAISFPVTSAWTMAGVGLRHLLTRPRFVRAFNWTMAALLVASLWPLLRDFVR